MADLTEFAEDGYNAKLWINQACQQRPGEEPLEKFLAELEMRLQLTAEEIESTLMDNSAQAMRRIPFAIQEIYRLQGDIQGMQDQVKIIASQVKRDAAEAAQAVEPISQLDKVKRNMESACSTLKEATELSGLFVLVEDVFATGDLPRVAEMLSSMRKSLSLVGDVPEFRAGRQKLKALEDRLQAMIEGTLADALSKSDAETIKRLAALLLAVDRYSTIETLYCNSRLSQVFSIWDDQQQGPDIVDWLPRFHSKLLAFLEQEHRWCAEVLPTLYARLVMSLVVAVFSKVSKSCMDKLSTVQSVISLTTLQKDAAYFVKCLLDLLKDSPVNEKRQVVGLVFSPLEARIDSYGDLERAQLSDELSVSYYVDASTEDVDTIVKKLHASVRNSFSALQHSIDRCIGLTGGTELKGLLRTIDAQLVTYLTKLQATVLQLQEKQGAVGPDLQDDSEAITSTLKLIKVSSELTSALTKLEGLVRTTLTNTVPKLEIIASKQDPLSTDAVHLRLVKSPERLAKLLKLAASTQESRFMALPNAAAQLDMLNKAVQTAVYDVLLAKVRQQLVGFSQLPVWRKTAESSVAVPSFSAYASGYVTVIGDYLMTLPQQLEVLMSDEGEDADGEELAAEWLDKVVTGAAALYEDQVLALPQLSYPGGVQLAADVEYFCNVMSALHVMPPATLLTVQLFAGQTSEQVLETAKMALAEGTVDATTLKAIAHMRQIDLGL